MHGALRKGIKKRQITPTYSNRDAMMIHAISFLFSLKLKINLVLNKEKVDTGKCNEFYIISQKYRIFWSFYFVLRFVSFLLFSWRRRGECIRLHFFFIIFDLLEQVLSINKERDMRRDYSFMLRGHYMHTRGVTLMFDLIDLTSKEFESIKYIDITRLYEFLYMRDIKKLIVKFIVSLIWNNK